MSERSIKDVFPALRDDIADLKTVRPIPSPLIQVVDPFLFLNHHGPQVYAAPNRGLPFGPHPHRGFQTVTFILDGDIAHRDSAGHESVIDPGGVQWMSAGRGLVHEEVSSKAFMKSGGPLEILQLWVNLPARLKMSEPYYVGLQRDKIPVFSDDDGRVVLQSISGEWKGVTGPFEPSTDIATATAEIKTGASLSLSIAKNRNVFFYVVRGKVEVNGEAVAKMHLVDFENDGEDLTVKALSDSLVLICHAEPYGEPIVYGGPFIMNTEKEIEQAYADFRAGKFGAEKL